MSEIIFTLHEEICVASFSGHLSGEIHDTLVDGVKSNLESKIKKYIFDFESVPMLDSPAIAAILCVAELIVDGAEGHLIFTNTNVLTSKVLETVGVFLYANNSKNLQEAFKELED